MRIILDKEEHMPPKPKFTKEEIVETALKLVSQRGEEGLTARDLGEALGSSARPIFTVFKNMEEVQEEVRKAAMQHFEHYAEQLLPGEPLFKQVGMKMVLFGAHEPKLYQMLFMREDRNDMTFDDVFGTLGTTADVCIESVQKDYGLSVQEAKELFKHVWIYTFGVGALCATRVGSFTEEQLGQMLSTEFQAMLLLIRSGRTHK